MTPAELKSALEAIIYAADEPATVEQMANAVGEERHLVRAALDELVGSYGSDERGIEIREVAGGFRVYTKPQHHDVVRRFIKSLRPPLRLTMPALETLAVIAYKQPITGPEIQGIRGVSAAGVIQTLLERRLITTAGRKHVLGRPILYRTSRDFLMRFGLSDLEDLPSLKEFEALAREALGTEDGVAEVEASDEPVGTAFAVEVPAESSGNGHGVLPDVADVAVDAGAAEVPPAAETAASEVASAVETVATGLTLASDAATAESEAASAVPAVTEQAENEASAQAATENQAADSAEAVPAETAESATRIAARETAEPQVDDQIPPAEKAAGSGAS